LELELQATQPDRTWEVINCGGVSYGSWRLVAVLKEVLQYAPDLIILATGENEFLEIALILSEVALDCSRLGGRRGDVVANSDVVA
jgi:hypothetical protein